MNNLTKRSLQWLDIERRAFKDLNPSLYYSYLHWHISRRGTYHK
jgi:hypothetical protein